MQQLVVYSSSMASYVKIIHSQLPSSNIHLHNLINPRILRHINTILLHNIPRQEPPSQKVSPLVPLHTRLRSRQTNQRLRHKVRPGPFPGRTGLDVPRARRVDAEDRDGRLFHERNDAGEWLAQGPAEREPEDGVYDEVCGSEGLREVVCEWDGEVFELGLEALFLVFY